MRWEWVAVSSTAVLVVSAAGITQALGPDGEEAAFRAYVMEHVGHRDELWVASHEDDVLAEGRRACAWLERRPSVDGIDRMGESEVRMLVTRYLADGRSRRAAPLSKKGERTLVAGAWAHLCEDVRDDD